MAGQQQGAKPGGLVAALKADAPPSNASTPNERINPQQTGLEHLKAASISLERSKEFIEDPQLVRVVDAMGGAITKALLQFDGGAVMQALQQSIGSGAPSPSPMTPPVAPGMGSAPPQGGPQGATPPAAPPAFPGMPGGAA